MVTRDLDVFFAAAKNCLPRHPGCAKSVFLLSPEGFSLAAESAQDNAYMNLEQSVQSSVALSQHQSLAHALSQQLPTICFPGRVETPDAIFPNNVFGTVQGAIILGHMRHPVRQAEADRTDILEFFQNLLGYQLIDLRLQSGICELTGALVIDRARNIGFCGLSERCDEQGAGAMAKAFKLDACLMFDLAPGEYHSNVVLSVLAGRAAVIAPSGFAEVTVAEAIQVFYGPNVLVLSEAEKNSFAANAIAVREDAVWMSQRAAQSLRPDNRAVLERAGFAVHSVDLSEIEKAGGSLRCCIGEIF